MFSCLALACVSKMVHECMNDVATVALECQSSGLQGVNNKQKHFDLIPVQQLREVDVVSPGKPRSQPIPQIVVHSTPKCLFLALQACTSRHQQLRTDGAWVNEKEENYVQHTLIKYSLLLAISLSSVAESTCNVRQVESEVRRHQSLDRSSGCAFERLERQTQCFFLFSGYVSGQCHAHIMDTHSSKDQFSIHDLA